jgi:hypothetical protein
VHVDCAKRVPTAEFPRLAIGLAVIYDLSRTERTGAVLLRTTLTRMA